MKASDLADKLENEYSSRKAEGLMLSEQDLILKSLRFAGYMELLESCCENIRLHKNGGAWYLDADRSDGPNIHSVGNNQSVLDAVFEAARKAVEELEAKK